jgi:hypothetical protein
MPLASTPSSGRANIVNWVGPSMALSGVEVVREASPCAS